MPNPHNPRPQYNPRRQQREAPKKQNRRTGASPVKRGQLPIEIPAWIWVIAGVAFGVLITFLFLRPAAPSSNSAQPLAVQKPLEEKHSDKNIVDKNNAEKTAMNVAGADKDQAALQEPKAADKSSAQQKNSSDTKSPDEKSAKPDETKSVTKFDFYTLLPEREVIVPTDRETLKAADKNKSASEQSQNSAATNEQLYLQVGSFRSAQEAERRRTQIRAQGLDAKIEEVTSNADTWYRVQAGPFAAREQLLKARDQLKAAGIESLLLRQK